MEEKVGRRRDSVLSRPPHSILHSMMDKWPGRRTNMFFYICPSETLTHAHAHTESHTESHTDGWVNRADCNLSLCDCVQLKHGLTLPCKLLIHLPCLFCASTLLAVKLNFLFSDQVYLRGASLFFCVHRYEGGKHTLQEKSWSHTVPLGEIIHTSWTFSTFCHIMNTNWIVRKMTHGG